jgi:hypothetical protein
VVHKPIVILKVESMSTGMPIDMNGPMTDDFTGEPITPVTKAMPVPPSAQSVIDQRNRAKAKASHKLLQSMGILPRPQTAQVTQSPRLVIKLKPKDWRRI